MIWSMDIKVDWRETEESRRFYHAAGKALALANDFYSWQAERTESTPDGRKWNVIPIVMDAHNQDEEAAKLLVRGMLIDAEQQVRHLGQRLAAFGGAWKDYVRGMESLLGGNAFWSASCPRYNQ